MAYTQVVEMLGENLASSLELLKKWLGWFGSFKPVIDRFHQIRKEDLMGLVKGSHEIVGVREYERSEWLSATIDLDSEAMPPWLNSSMKIESHIGEGKVLIEKRSPNDLYIDGKKVVLYRPKLRLVSKDDIQREIAEKPLLNACVLGFLKKNPEFIPDTWKKKDYGDTLRVHFLGTIWRSADDFLWVRFACFDHGEWREGIVEIYEHGWDGRDPVARLEA
ncbi:MAG: hypothetical protein R3B39_00080 [Candidatus Paceibacterota bacterium]